MSEDKEKLKVLTTEFRVSHPHLFKPTGIKGSEKLNYSIEMLFDKKITELSKLNAPLRYAAAMKWGAKEDWPSPLKMPIRDGDKPYGKSKEIKEEHKGMWVVKASTSAEFSKPTVVGRDPNVPLENEAEIYPGCYARAELKAHAYTFADKDGVKFILNAVQFIRDGKAMGGRKPANQIFGVIEGDAESFDAPLDEGIDGEESGAESFM